MPEIGPSGSGGGKGKRSLVQYWHATAPLLDFISRPLRMHDCDLDSSVLAYRNGGWRL